ncbi:MAG: hypothetical protein KF825_09145 [Ferruginibacter sp.]|nr:hypothetical protein [Ferruginibacter sp.]
MNYSFTLKDNNANAYRLFTWFLFFLHISIAGLMAVSANDKAIKTGLFILVGFYILIAALFYFTREQKNAFETFSFTMALFYAGFWMKHVGLVAFFVFTALFLFVNFIRKKKAGLLVCDTGVQLKGILKKVEYSWPDIDNLVLKDGLLTVDFISNKLLQYEIDTDTNPVDENEFNRFCMLHLNKQ